MESSGSAVVDFGRFCTGFLVVMGIGMCSAHHLPCLSDLEKGRARGIGWYGG